MDNSQNLSLGEAARRFLASLTPDEGKRSQQEIYRFVRWYGAGYRLTVLSAPEVANYAERLSLSYSDYASKLEQIKVFLQYAKKEGWIKSTLATHLKPRKGKNKFHPKSKRSIAEIVSLTRQGYEDLKAELETLKSKRVDAISEITKAAADKDFRENAPLEAAREEHGQLMGRIKELEETIKAAVVIGEKQKPTLKVSIGDRVTLQDLACGEELCYTIVSSREVDPAAGRISCVSPIGKVVLSQEQGKVIEAVTPAGRARYRITRIEH